MDMKLLLKNNKNTSPQTHNKAGVKTVMLALCMCLCVPWYLGNCKDFRITPQGFAYLVNFVGNQNVYILHALDISAWEENSSAEIPNNYTILATMNVCWTFCCVRIADVTAVENNQIGLLPIKRTLATTENALRKDSIKFNNVLDVFELQKITLDI
uniref:Uncharacterized protein n=1 Tax=Glossina austeni TaxID=7395 RepID=A0A1A9VTT5_GLOAU